MQENGISRKTSLKNNLWGHAYDYNFSKNYIVYYRKRLETLSSPVSFPGNTMIKLKNILKSCQI